MSGKNYTLLIPYLLHRIVLGDTVQQLGLQYHPAQMEFDFFPMHKMHHVLTFKA